MSVAKGQLVGDKNGMYGKKHTDESRKKMSDGVLKAYAEGKIPKLSEYCQRLGVAASARLRETSPEKWSKRLTSYILWLYENTYKGTPTFLTDVGLQEAFALEESEPQSKYWTALLQINWDKVEEHLEAGRIAQSFSFISKVIGSIVPPEAHPCYNYTFVMERFRLDCVNELVTDYIIWMLGNKTKLENYLASNYAVNGIRKAQYLEILKRRYKSNWADNNRSVEVKQSKDAETEESTITVTFTA